jgi:hypothetical protein
MIAHRSGSGRDARHNLSHADKFAQPVANLRTGINALAD